MSFYSQAFNIPAGTSYAGGGNAISVVSTAASGITANVRLWRDDPNGTPTTISMRGGEILPLKVRTVFCATNQVTLYF